jgi:hypothetical protein
VVAPPIFAPNDVVQAARVDTRPRWRRMLPIIFTGAGVCAALGLILVVDPNQPGHYPTCPTQTFLGVDCPGCGAMRGTNALLRGDLVGAADQNVLLLLLLPVVLVMAIFWVRRAWTGVHPAVTFAQFRDRNRIMITSLIAVLAFGVIRNFVPFIGSGVG